MSISQMVANAGKDHLPKVISPGVHAVIDYAVAGSFLLMGGLFWKNNKRASAGAFMIGGAMLAESLCTDYPGGVTDVISFQMHGKLDTGMAGLIASLPDLLGFKSEPEAKHFRMQGFAEAMIVGLTDWNAGSSQSELEMRKAV